MTSHPIPVALPLLVLGISLGAAVWHDVRSRRIPNRVVLAGTAGALLLHVFLPAGAGLFRPPSGGMGVLFSLAGFATGLLLLLPFYAMRTLGAGDVKLMAMVGAFIGPFGVMGATLLSMLAGGILALVVAVWSGHLGEVIGNVQQVLRNSLTRGIAGRGIAPAEPDRVTGKLAYAIAIACGTAGQLILSGWPAWRFFA